jgi:hypothetical protein
MEDSEFVNAAPNAILGAAQRLWREAFWGDPAGSLPDNVRILAHKAHVREDEWVAYEAEDVMHGFKRYADGRLYHNVVCEEVQHVIDRASKGKHQTAAATAKRWQNTSLVRDVSATESVTEFVSNNGTSSKSTMSNNGTSKLSVFKCF